VGGTGVGSSSAAGQEQPSGSVKTLVKAAVLSPAPRRFVPPILDHDPFAGGEEFNSRERPSVDSRIALANQEPADADEQLNTNDHWPSPIVDQTDPVDVLLSTSQPTGGTTYFTPEIRPPDSDSTASALSATPWVRVETISAISTGGETDTNWIFRQLKRKSKDPHALQPLR